MAMRIGEVFVKDPEWPNESKGTLYLEEDSIVVRISKFPDKVLLKRNDVILPISEIKKWSRKSRKSLYKRIPMLRIRTKKGIYEISFPEESGKEQRDKVITWLEEKTASQKEETIKVS